MAFLLKELIEILNRPTVGSVLVELVSSLRPILVAVLVGLLVGWVWKPLKWPLSLGGEIPEDSDPPPNSTPSLPSERFNFGSFPSLNSLKAQLQSCISIAGVSEEKDRLSEGNGVSQVRKEKGVVSAEDFDYLCQLVEVRDGGPIWIQMMDRSTASMSYQAWRRDPQSGPPQYRSRTVFEDAAPELVRNFFWDDEFRSKWDDMLIYSSTLEDCPTTGTMVVQWVRKFPFFCSDREYIIGRRIWESGGSYYCVTKGVPCTSVPRRNKPRRVDLYYSSWCIRAVESRRGDGQLTSCEVLLFHYEDMGIPWEIAKLGIRQGMWGTVKKIEPGLRAYQMERQTGGPLSRSAIMAQINTKISRDHLRSLEITNHDSSEVENSTPEKQLGRKIRKFLVIGGAVVVAASLDRGLLTKAVIFGVARKFGKLGRGL